MEEFFDDIREKKKALKRGSGVSKKRPRKVIFPMDMGNRSEKRFYRKNGICFSYNLEEAYTMKPEDLTFEEFLAIKEPLKARNIFKDYFAGYSDSQLGEMWGVNKSTIVQIRKKLGIVKNTSGTVIKLENKIDWPVEMDHRGWLVSSWSVERGERPEVREKEVNKQEKEKRTLKKAQPEFVVRINGVFSAEELEVRLNTLSKLLQVDVDNYYYVEIRFKEVRAKKVQDSDTQDSDNQGSGGEEKRSTEDDVDLEEDFDFDFS